MTRIDLPLIDCHTHIGQLPGVLGDAYAAEDLVYIMEREGVERMLFSSASSSCVSQACGTDEALAALERHRDRLSALIWINPRDPGWRTDAERAAEAGFVGIKLHPVLDHYAVEVEALAPIWDLAREKRWPILTHADVDGTLMSAGRYEPLLSAYPDVSLLLAHLRLEAIPLAKRYANAYLDTTYVDPLMVEVGVDAVGAAKILFGSDAAEGFDVGRRPGRERPPRSYADLLAGLRARGIAGADLRAIAAENARCVFALAE